MQGRQRYEEMQKKRERERERVFVWVSLARWRSGEGGREVP